MGTLKWFVEEFKNEEELPDVEHFQKWDVNRTKYITLYNSNLHLWLLPYTDETGNFKE